MQDDLNPWETSPVLKAEQKVCVCCCHNGFAVEEQHVGAGGYPFSLPPSWPWLRQMDLCPPGLPWHGPGLADAFFHDGQQGAPLWEGGWGILRLTRLGLAAAESGSSRHPALVFLSSLGSRSTSSKLGETISLLTLKFLTPYSAR